MDLKLCHKLWMHLEQRQRRCAGAPDITEWPTLNVSPFFWDLVTLVSISMESLALGQRMRLPSHLMKIVFINVISSTCSPPECCYSWLPFRQMLS